MLAIFRAEPTVFEVAFQKFKEKEILFGSVFVWLRKVVVDTE
jgi:hypothetical protein